MYDTRLEVGYSYRETQSEIDSGLVSEMGRMDATYPLPMHWEQEPEEVATTVKKDLQETLFPSL